MKNEINKEIIEIYLTDESKEKRITKINKKEKNKKYFIVVKYKDITIGNMISIKILNSEDALVNNFDSKIERHESGYYIKEYSTNNLNDGKYQIQVSYNEMKLTYEFNINNNNTKLTKLFVAASILLLALSSIAYRYYFIASDNTNKEETLDSTPKIKNGNGLVNTENVKNTVTTQEILDVAKKGTVYSGIYPEFKFSTNGTGTVYIENPEISYCNLSVLKGEDIPFSSIDTIQTIITKEIITEKNNKISQVLWKSSLIKPESDIQTKELIAALKNTTDSEGNIITNYKANISVSGYDSEGNVISNTDGTKLQSVNSIKATITDINGKELWESPLELTEADRDIKDLSKKLETSVFKASVIISGYDENGNWLSYESARKILGFENITKIQTTIIDIQTGEEFWTSPLLEPGTNVQRAELNKKLEEGVYKVYTTTNGFDKDENWVGNSGTEGTLTVK